MRGSGVGVPFGGPRDVADHAAEDQPVERRDGPPVQVPGQPAGQEDGALAVARARVRARARRSAPARRGPGPSSRRAAAAGARPSVSSSRSTRHQSRASPVCRRSGSRRPRRSPTPPTSRSSQPRTDQASGNEYQPRPPPMPSTTDHSASGPAVHGRSRSSRYTRAAGPLRVAGQRVARRRRCRAASDQRVSTSPRTDLGEGERDGAVVADAPLGRVGHVLEDVVLAADHLVHQRVDQRARRWPAAPASRG